MDAYREPTDEEREDIDADESYQFLLGPDGFECMLGEPEDRNWWRDAKPVVKRLNEQHTEIQQLKARIECLERELDPPVCRLQFPDGVVPGNVFEAAEGWKRWADEFSSRLERAEAPDPEPPYPGL